MTNEELAAKIVDDDVFTVAISNMENPDREFGVCEDEVAGYRARAIKCLTELLTESQPFCANHQNVGGACPICRIAELQAEMKPPDDTPHKAVEALELAMAPYKEIELKNIGAAEIFISTKDDPKHFSGGWYAQISGDDIRKIDAALAELNGGAA